VKRASRFGLLLELALFAASFTTGRPVAEGIRMIGVFVAAVLGALVIFCAVVLTVGVVAQRQPPYEM
jgi:hypothetical protein